ncbi:MAG: hypothetical protein AAGI71_08675 [Bacteroidota bacterium]
MSSYGLRNLLEQSRAALSAHQSQLRTIARQDPDAATPTRFADLERLYQNLLRDLDEALDQHG